MTRLITGIITCLIAGLITGLVALFALSAAPAFADPVLNSAVLPNARTVPVADTATIFMTTLNSGDMDATNCMVVKSRLASDNDDAAVDLNWALIGAGGALGSQNAPFTIAANGSVNMVLGIARNATPFGLTPRFKLIFHVECDGGFGSIAAPGVNGAEIFFSDTEEDIIPIIQTLTADGIANFDDTNRFAVVSVAAVNNSAIKNGTGPVKVFLKGTYPGFTEAGQFGYLACETDPANGNCLSGPVTCDLRFACLTTMLGATPKTFSFFLILPTGQGAPFLPDTYRFAVEFEGPMRALGGKASTSVALNSSVPPGGPVRPIGQYELVVRNSADRDAKTLRMGNLTISGSAISGNITRMLDMGGGPIIEDNQYFEGDGVFMAAPGPDKPQSGAAKPLGNSTTNGSVDFYSSINFFDIGASEGRSFQMTMDYRDGGTMTFPSDAPAEQITGQPEYIDAGQRMLLQLIPKNNAPSLAQYQEWPITSVTDILNGAQGQVMPGPDAMNPNMNATFSLDGCDWLIGDPMQDIVNGLAIVNAIALTLTGCIANPDLLPFVGTTETRNIDVEKRNANLDKLDYVFNYRAGGPRSPTGAVIDFLTSPPSGSDQPQASAAPASRRQ